MRTAGAIAIVIDGRLAGWLCRGEEHLLTFVPDEAEAERVRPALAQALAAEVAPEKLRTLFIQSIDGAPVDESPFAEALLAAGFARTPRGYLKRITHA